MAITPFKIDISDSELDLLSRKLELARLPTNIANEQWGEDNGVTVNRVSETVKFWRESYSWRKEEARLNEMPQFRTPIDVDGFGTLDIHFVHSTSPSKGAIPLLFLHGWPGSFSEIQKALPRLHQAGFHVVSPSLPGYGFSSYPDKKGFKHVHHAEVMHKLMSRLGYKQYVVQGGDWGAFITRCLGIMYPESVKAIHMNMIMMPKPDFDKEPEYTPFEKASLERNAWFSQTQSAYLLLQGSKPRTLGFAMHDSPVGMLAWMADKVFVWSDAYPWTPTELITWTLLHYFPGPTTGFQMYKENDPAEMAVALQGNTYVKVPTGVSAFPKELGLMPRSWAERQANVVFWREHSSGGHFAAYERPEELAGDLIDFYKQVWKV
ncbi:glycosylphosphatidylinositol anchor biosynthesis [Exophiala xenobiotica]|nr:glycosylphosphatidylinositol anchor biosynthesis [Exophiala xenobiotica]KAK5241800.1 glycosylphosphatidylinositol anchor biosynthesis [Exophiala xenobiotica]KAK5279855.1 glycosylphosphatidylinositol anchor biosynthesis [Exophiala xenobiotica]KAK5352925.1 glycosylphosphatidylinositol anchor biosynthesis [Exophiala xenobiotica]KAK5375790.1 glycosylphosphatidylinositol anchor biosynthesis [Exophiala xenobiotica]